MHSFILAGGFATRLWPLTEHRAKPLLPLLGKPLLTHIVEGIPKGIPVTVSSNAAFENDLLAWKESTRRSAVSVRIERTTHDDEKLGALGATMQWISEDNIDDDILLLAGDNYMGFSMERFLSAQRKGTPLLAAYDIGELAQARAFGTVILEEGGTTIRAFEEKPQEPKSTLVSTGCSVIPKEHLPLLVAYAKEHPDNIGGVFEEFLRQNIPVDCWTFTERWFDIGSFAAYLDATKALLGDRTLLGNGSSAEQSELQGSVVIGNESHVRDSTCSDTVLFDGCLVEDCILDRCILDDGCRLKGVDLRGKMLRAGTVLKR